MSESKNDFSRRNFIKSACATTVVAGVATTGLLAGTKNAEADTQITKTWDMEADVVVVGSGFAALSAAIEAKNGGASVMVLEKMPVMGGNSTINGGLFSACRSPFQKAQGVEGSVDLMLGDMKKAGLGLNYVPQARLVAEKSLEAWLWTRDFVGVKWKEKAIHLGGHSVPRSIPTANGSGSGVIRPMLKKCKEIGVLLKKKTYVKHLIQDGSGRVIGLEVLTNYKSGDKGRGKKTFIKANRAVVMGSGGFGADVAYRQTQDPRLTTEIDKTNHEGATAECLQDMLRIGANPVQLSWIQLGPWASPDEKGLGVVPFFGVYSAFPHGVMVAPKTGERFVNELADRKVRADAIINTGEPAIAICDADAFKRTPEHLTKKILERKVGMAFDTLDELAAFYKMPTDKLKAQVKRMNKYIIAKDDPEFNKQLNAGQKPITKAPFYAVRLWPKVHHCMGGVQIDTQARVINIQTQKPIEGLFAAGEATGGTHGAVRLGSCAIPDCVVFGRIAGQNAAKA